MKKSQPLRVENTRVGTAGTGSGTMATGCVSTSTRREHPCGVTDTMNRVVEHGVSTSTRREHPCGKVVEQANDVVINSLNLYA